MPLHSSPRHNRTVYRMGDRGISCASECRRANVARCLFRYFPDLAAFAESESGQAWTDFGLG